jgi:hypothetical protein
MDRHYVELARQQERAQSAIAAIRHAILRLFVIVPLFERSRDLIDVLPYSTGAISDDVLVKSGASLIRPNKAQSYL